MISSTSLSPPQPMTPPETDRRGGGAPPGPTDIICGRGCSRHLGNAAFRVVVRRRRAEYASLGMLEKSDLVRSVVDAAARMDPPGRFLQKGEDGMWRDVGKKKAMEKTRKALQERRDDGLGREPDDAAVAEVVGRFESAIADTTACTTEGEYTHELSARCAKPTTAQSAIAKTTGRECARECPVMDANVVISGMPSAHPVKLAGEINNAAAKVEQINRLVSAASVGAVAPPMRRPHPEDMDPKKFSPKRPAEDSPAEGVICLKKARRIAFRPVPEATTVSRKDRDENDGGAPKPAPPYLRPARASSFVDFFRNIPTTLSQMTPRLLQSSPSAPGEDDARKKGHNQKRMHSAPAATDGSDDSRRRRSSLWLPLNDSEMQVLMEDVAGMPAGRGGVLEDTVYLGEATQVSTPSEETKMRRRSSIFSFLWSNPIGPSEGFAHDKEDPEPGTERRRSSIFSTLWSPRRRSSIFSILWSPQADPS